MKKLFFILVLLISAGQSCWAQSPQENLDKYWAYRDRFLGTNGTAGFIDIGIGPGKSLPMEGRNPAANCQSDYFITHSDCETKEGKGLLNWVDATVHLGYYIAMLATEFYNLKDSNQPKVANATKQELYYALKAVERLDTLAEIVCGVSPSLDGFFIRDDIPTNYYQSGNQLRFGKANGFQFNCVKSSYACGANDVGDGSFISQDQVLALIFGFTFVHSLMGEEPLEQEDSLATFGDFVALLTHRIADNLVKSKWRIKGPEGKKIPNKYGGDVRAFNNAIAKAASRICGKKYRNSYHKGSFRAFGWAINGVMNWGFGLQADRNKSMIFQSVVASNKWNSRKIARRAIKSDKVMYALAYALVNKKSLHKKVKLDQLVPMINLAPLEGPCFGTPDCKAPDGWKSSDRWWHSDYKNGNPHGAHYEYSGIDFMLLYNLYYAHYKEALKLPPYRRRFQN